MGKIVKLTESNIRQIVNALVNEQLNEDSDNHELAKLRTQYKLDSIMERFKDVSDLYTIDYAKSSVRKEMVDGYNYHEADILLRFPRKQIDEYIKQHPEFQTVVDFAKKTFNYTETDGNIYNENYKVIRVRADETGAKFYLGSDAYIVEVRYKETQPHDVEKGHSLRKEFGIAEQHNKKTKTK